MTDFPSFMDFGCRDGPTISPHPFLPIPTLKHGPESAGGQAGILREVAGELALLRPIVSRTGVQAPHRPTSDHCQQSSWLRRSPFSERRTEEGQSMWPWWVLWGSGSGQSPGRWENLKLVKQKLGTNDLTTSFAISIPCSENSRSHTRNKEVKVGPRA